MSEKREERGEREKERSGTGVGTTGSKLKRAEHLGFPSESLFDAEKKLTPRFKLPTFPPLAKFPIIRPNWAAASFTLSCCVLWLVPGVIDFLFEGFYFLSLSQH